MIITHGFWGFGFTQIVYDALHIILRYIGYFHAAEITPFIRLSFLSNKRGSLHFQGAGRLFLIFQIQNGNDQQSKSKYDLHFLICTHNNHPFRKARIGREHVPRLPGEAY